MTWIGDRKDCGASREQKTSKKEKMPVMYQSDSRPESGIDIYGMKTLARRFPFVPREVGTATRACGTRCAAPVFCRFTLSEIAVFNATRLRDQPAHDPHQATRLYYFHGALSSTASRGALYREMRAATEAVSTRPSSW